MKNNIVYTQDVPGEREWLLKLFPTATNLETEFSGKWPVEPFVQSFDAVWEIPPDSQRDVSRVDGIRYKSLFQLDTEFISPRWCQSEQLLFNNSNITFGSGPRSTHAQVLHFPRSGTIFLESILFPICKYRKDRGWNPNDPSSDHRQLGGDDRLLYKSVAAHQPDIFFCYRKNWWEWFVSFQIGEQFEQYHYNDIVDWDSLQPFEISVDQIEDRVREITAGWNALCHFRTVFPKLNFYIFEFSDLIQNQHLTEHRKINYDKKKLIKNYNWAKELFESTYAARFDTWTTNSLAHLQTMHCKILKNFDGLIA